MEGRLVDMRAAEIPPPVAVLAPPGMSNSRPSVTLPLALALLAGAGLLAGACSGGAKAKKPTTPIEIATERMMRSEANLLSWSKTGRLSGMGDAAKSLEFPGELCRKYFSETFTLQGLVEELPEYDEVLNEGTAGIRHWQPSKEKVTVYAGAGDTPEGMLPFEHLDMFSSLFAQVDYFDWAKFKVYIPVPTWDDPETMRQWRVTLLFAGKALMKNGRLGVVKGKNEVLWEMQPGSYDEPNPDEQEWKIVSWKVKSLKVTETDGWLFEEVLDEAIPDSESLELARQSIHEQYVREFLQAHRDKDPKSFTKPYPYFQVGAGERHPTVVVCDYDMDGWDDFYAQERHGRNLFFRNNGDGTFTEIAEEIGLAFGEEGKTSSTIFADFDNDGDEDAFVGGGLMRSRILENIDGKFVDRSDEWIAEGDLPFHTSAVNAVDYDGDGLLDIYVSTYAAFFVQRAMTMLRSEDNRFKNTEARDFILYGLKPFLPERDWDLLWPMVEEAAKVAGVHTDRPGPPNVMLKNMGDGRFEVAMIDELRDFHNTFQTTWADIDNDGDPDAYLANDFAPNFMIVNNGDGTFTDVTDQLQLADIGFGMGVTWGDYDGDGLQDLYVTNMFSKAARRVTSFFTAGRANFDEELLGKTGGIDPVFEQLGRGNSLFNNKGMNQPWDKVSGMEKPKLLVEQGGWAWGAQFADFNNDGWLDIYNPSGYYTAPKDKKRDVDL